MFRLTDKPRLFVDLGDVELRENVVRVFHQATKYGRSPVLKQEAPWERHSGMTASVIYDEEERVFKAWYMAGVPREGHAAHVQCLALSQDGIHWERPDLGVHEFAGSKRNNIVIPSTYHDGMDHWESMLKDPLVTGDPEGRAHPAQYKAIGWSSYDWDGPGAGIYSAWSPDGIRWSHTPEAIFHLHPRPGTSDRGPIGDAQSFMIDSRRKRYVAFLRDGMRRSMSVSEDFVVWSDPRPFLDILNEEETLYNNTGFVYADQYLGFLTHFNRNAYEQTQTLQPLSSRDGDTWHRPGFGQTGYRPLIPIGDVGEWDRFQIMLTGGPPIRVGEKLFIYYRGTSRRHNKVKGEFEPRIDPDQDEPRFSPAHPGFRTTMAIGMATLRLDGFASMSASYDGGWMQTRPLAFAGDNLSINVVSDYGEVHVEVLDEAGKPIPGYTREDCIPVALDSIDAPVTWKDRASVAELAGRTVKLRFHLRNARLYSYRCTG